MVYLSPARSLLYVTDIRSSPKSPIFPSRKFEHLSCFFPGLLALGVDRLPEDDFTPYGGADERQRHLWAAEGLAVSCGTMYSDMPTGLGADEVVFTSRWEMEWQRANQERQKEVLRLKDEADRLAKEWEKAEGEEGAYGAETLTTPTDAWMEETTALPETRTVLKRDQHGEVYATGRDLIDGIDPARQNAKPKPRPRPKYPQITYPPPVSLNMNQTAEDEKLRWANVLEAWRRGRYDGARNVWLDAEGKEVPQGFAESTNGAKGEVFQGGRGAGGGAHGGEVGHGGVAGHGSGPAEHEAEHDPAAVEEMKVIGPPKGPVPGLRDPPPDAPPATNLRDYRSQNSGYYLRPEVSPPIHIISSSSPLSLYISKILAQRSYIFNLQNPSFQTIESFFIMWRTTGNVVWRERGWAAFLALERECRTPSGYAALRNAFFSSATGTDTSAASGTANGVKSGGGWSTNQLDSMPSYFLAETLKYLYLLFSDEGLLPLDKYVLNTEAHPFPVFEWTEWEKEKFGIPS